MKVLPVFGHTETVDDTGVPGRVTDRVSDVCYKPLLNYKGLQTGPWVRHHGEPKSGVRTERSPTSVPQGIRSRDCRGRLRPSKGSPRPTGDPSEGSEQTRRCGENRIINDSRSRSLESSVCRSPRRGREVKSLLSFRFPCETLEHYPSSPPNQVRLPRPRPTLCRNLALDSVSSSQVSFPRARGATFSSLDIPREGSAEVKRVEGNAYRGDLEAPVGHGTSTSAGTEVTRSSPVGRGSKPKSDDVTFEKGGPRPKPRDTTIGGSTGPSFVSCRIAREGILL